MAAWRYEISLLVLKKYFTRSLRSLVKYFSILEEKFRISARPCNILYVFMPGGPLIYAKCHVQIVLLFVYATTRKRFVYCHM